MESIKKYTRPLAIALIVVVVAVPVLLFSHFRQNDTQAFADYSASYQQFDQTISDYAKNSNDNAVLASQVDNALNDLQRSAAAFRLSSLVENDGKLMDQTRVVAELSARELESLKAYKQSAEIKSVDAAALAKTYEDLAGKRKAADAQFRELAGLEN